MSGLCKAVRRRGTAQQSRRQRRGVAVTALLLGSQAVGAAPALGAPSWKAGGYAEVYAVAKGKATSQRQRPAGILSLNLSGAIRPGVRTYLDLRTTFGGPAESAGGAGVANLTDTFQDISPSVEFEEGYFDILLARVDLRIGKQKIAWGRLDSFQPTDVINPRRYTDPFVTEEDDAKLGIPAVRASFFLGRSAPRFLSGGRISLVWIPVPFPVRFPTEDERWFPPAASVPASLQIPAGVLGEGLPELEVRTNFRTENAVPPQQLDHGGVGLRVTGFAAGADWSLYYYDGPETAPSLDLRTSVASPRARALVEQGQLPTIGDLLVLDVDARLRPRFGRIRLVGVDAAFALSGAAMRAELAFGSNRSLPRTIAALLSLENLSRSVGPNVDPIIAQLLQGRTVAVDLGDLFVRREMVEWGLGLDYPVRGWTPVVQVNQTLVFGGSTGLLLDDVSTRLLLALRRSFLADRLRTEIVLVQGLERSSTTGVGRFTYAFADNVRVRLGYLFLAGSRNTLLGQYKSNDEVFLQVRYSR